MPLDTIVVTLHAPAADLVAHYSADLARFAPRLQYVLINESDYTNEELCSEAMKESKNLVSALFRLENSTENGAIYEVVSELLTWLELPRQQPLSRAIAAWYNRVFKDSKQEFYSLPEFEDLTEVKSMLQETIKEWREEAKRLGRAEGKEEEKFEIARVMKKNGEPNVKISKYTGLSEKEIEDV